MTEGSREFQVVGASQLKDRLLMSVRLKGTSRSRTADDCSDLVPLHDALMCRLRYAGTGIVLYSLQLADGAGWSAMENSVAVVDPGKDQTTCKRQCEVRGQQMTYVAGH